jgi:hypothetical protein
MGVVRSGYGPAYRQADRPICKNAFTLHKMLVETEVKKWQRKLASLIFWSLSKIATVFQTHEMHYDVNLALCSHEYCGQIKKQIIPR